MSTRTETSTIHEYDTVELLVDLPNAQRFYPEPGSAHLRAGDRGVVVSAHDEDRSITIEFFREGETVAITDVDRERVRRVEESDNASSAHLEFALLADNARFLPHKAPRFNVIGGAVTQGTPAKVPATYPHLSVIIGVGYERHGLDVDHEVVVTFRHPDDPRIRVGPVTGGVWEPSRTVTHPAPALQFEPESVVDVILVPYANPYFSDYGRYEFRITIDGREVKTLYFTIARPKT